jgi:prepilin-type N-terminal cleavage/methylation domain-containing protein
MQIREVGAMITNVGKVLKSREGFTLVELITVIVLLGVILGIGVPKYSAIQAQSEWDADLATLKSMEKAAEIWYALYQDEAGVVEPEKVVISELHEKNLFDKNTKLKRLRVEVGTKSRRLAKTIGTVHEELTGLTPTVTIDSATGNAVWEDYDGDGVNDWITEIIGLRPPNGVENP